MKPRIFFISVLFLFSTLPASRVRADNNYNNYNNGGNDTALPINSGLTFLIIAGTAIGILAVKKSRSAAKTSVLNLGTNGKYVR